MGMLVRSFLGHFRGRNAPYIIVVRSFLKAGPGYDQEGHLPTASARKTEA
jgi:hypothetical protein